LKSLEDAGYVDVKAVQDFHDELEQAKHDEESSLPP